MVTEVKGLDHVQVYGVEGRHYGIIMLHMGVAKVTEMKAEFFPPREDIILLNEAPSVFYILVSGSAVGLLF